MAVWTQDNSYLLRSLFQLFLRQTAEAAGWLGLIVFSCCLWGVRGAWLLPGFDKQCLFSYLPWLRFRPVTLCLRDARPGLRGSACMDLGSGWGAEEGRVLKGQFVNSVLMSSASTDFPHPAWIKDQNAPKWKSFFQQPNVPSPFQERLASPTLTAIISNGAQRPLQLFAYINHWNANLSGHMSVKSNAGSRSGNVSAPRAQRKPETLTRFFWRHCSEQTCAHLRSCSLHITFSTLPTCED